MGEDVNLQSDFYFTLVIDFIQSQISIFFNGKEIGSDKCNKSWLVSGFLNNGDWPFTVGMMRSGGVGNLHEGYACGTLYCCRLYSRILTEKELNDNYLKTVSFHKAETVEN